MTRFTRTLVTVAAAAGTAFVVARLVRRRPAFPPPLVDLPDREPPVQVDDLSDDDRDALLDELAGQV